MESLNCTNCTFVEAYPDHDYEQWEDGHHMSQSFSTFASTYLIIIISISIFFNLVLITIIVTKRSLRTTYAHIFVINLAISDLITAITTVPFDVDFLIKKVFNHGTFACGIMQTTFLISLPSSLISLLLLTMERFSAVMFPFQRLQVIRHNYLTPGVISLTWVYTIVTALIPIMLNDNAVVVNYGYCVLDFSLSYAIFQLSVNFALPIFAICVMDIALYTKARENKRTLKDCLRSARNEAERKSSVHRIQECREDIRASNRILALVIVTVVCWLAYIILVVKNISCGICHSEEVTYAGNLINYSSIALNPILYGLMNSKIRKEVYNILARVCRIDLLQPRSSNLSSYTSSRRQTYEMDISRYTAQRRRGVVKSLSEYSKLDLSTGEPSSSSD